MNNIRNFAIIAHIDHGKSTLADRLLELTGTVKGKHDEQMLDRNPISRERGITIKLAPVTMKYELPSANDELQKAEKSDEQKAVILNLVDTPGHVDFSYEVERTLACVEGVVLLVDATKGIQAQTIAHAYKAFEQDLTIIPVVNKVDMENAQVEKTVIELALFLNCSEHDVHRISAKTGFGVPELLKTIIEKIPPPALKKFENDHVEITRALIFDSYYDSHRGVIAFVRVFGGSVKKATKLHIVASNTDFEVNEVGTFLPELTPASELQNGSIGYIATNLKDIHLVRVGDTLVELGGTYTLLPGYRKAKPMIFTSIFPTDPDEYGNLKKALEKLYLNDSALVFEQIYSKAFGGGFRVGFLGLLHADVTRERLEREFDLSLVLTPPKVEYQKDDSGFREPYVKVTVISPAPFMGAIMTLCENSRAAFITMDTVAKGYEDSQVVMVYEMPLYELIGTFFDRLKSVTSGYASLDWEFMEYRTVKADKLEILLNTEPVEEFSEVVVTERSVEKGRELCTKLKEVIPRQQFEVRIQASYKGKVIASEKISPFRKDVTQKLYGGDRTRKDKLLNKQKKGKKMMKNIGKVEIPKEAFLKLFKLSSK